MKRRTFLRTASGIAGSTAVGIGVAAGHTPGAADDDNAENACHTEGAGNKDQEDEGDARAGEDPRNPECEP